MLTIGQVVIKGIILRIGVDGIVELFDCLIIIPLGLVIDSQARV